MTEFLKSTERSSVPAYIKRTGIALLISMAVSGILLLVLAIFMTFTEFPEFLVRPLVQGIQWFSIFLAGLEAARKSRRKGWRIGMISGGLYMFVLKLLGVACFHTISWKSFLLALLSGIIFGALGGITGINMKK